MVNEHQDGEPVLRFRWQHSRRRQRREGGSKRRERGEEPRRTDRMRDEASLYGSLSFLARVSQHACLVTPLGRRRGRGHVTDGGVAASSKGEWPRRQRSYSRPPSQGSNSAAVWKQVSPPVEHPSTHPSTHASIHEDRRTQENQKKRRNQSDSGSPVANGNADWTILASNSTWNTYSD